MPPPRTFLEPSPRHSTAFTLVEALVAMTILSVAGGAILLGVDSAVQTTNDCLERTIAGGMARQLLDEVLGARYSDYVESGGVTLDTAHASQLGPTATKSATNTRELFTSIGDYHGFRAQPPVDAWGVALGQDGGELRTRHPNFRAPTSMIRQWRQEIDVYYVSGTDLSPASPQGQTSDYRAVEVRIVRVDAQRGNRVLASLRQVVAYVSPLP